MYSVIKSVGERVIAFLAASLRMSLVAALALMLGCIALQVVMRYVFGRPPSWTEELAVLMFAWTTMGGLAIGVHQGFHVRLDLLINLFRGVSREVAERILDAIAAFFGAYLCWSGVRFYDMTTGSTSAAIGYPIEILHVLAPICGGLIFVFASWRVIAGRPDEQVEATPA